MTKDTDIELVQACLRGDQRAAERFVEQFQSPIFNAAYRIVGNQTDAQDVSQTVFLKVFEHLDAYKPEFRLFSWVYRIAINESISFSKRRPITDALVDEQLVSQDRPDDAFASKHLGGQIQQALLQLSEDYRAVIVLKHIAGFSYQEISDLLEVPEKTVRSRLYTARQRLQTWLIDVAESSLNTTE